MRPRLSGDLRRANRVEVMRSFYGGRTLTRGDVAGQLGVSVATVGTIIAELTAAGLLEESQSAKSAGGRPASRLRMRGAAPYLIGVDLAETYVIAEIFDQAMTRLGHFQMPVVPSDNAPESVVGHVVDCVEGVITALDGVGAADVAGVGVSLPGQVDRAGGVSIHAPNWGWHGVPFKSLFQRRSGLPVLLDNPLKAITLAEMMFGEAGDHDDAVVVNLGTGVGLGVVADGRLLRGRTNSAGEWGHTVLVADGRPCHCGSRGCVEAYVGAAALLDLLTEVDPDSPLLVPEDQAGTVARLAEAVGRADPVAVATLERFARPLGMALANAVNMLNPELLVVGGWVSAAFGEPLLAAVEPVVKEFSLTVPYDAVTLTTSRIADNPVSLGMAVLAFETFVLP
ncbi:MAG: ROK family protein [Catenulispora sp.]